MDVRNLALYGLVVILQFLDWLTTKIFTRYNPLAEGNPFFHKKFAKNGGPSLGFLFQKLFVACLTIYFLFKFQNRPVMYDMILGIGVWLMFHVVIHNTSGVMRDLVRMKLGIYKSYAQNDLLEARIGGIFRDTVLFLFLTAIGVVVYNLTQRTFILWTAAGIVMIIGMSIYSAFQLYHSR